MNTLKRLLASLLIASTAAMGLPFMAQARVITTDEAIASADTLTARDKVSAFLARADVATALQGQGVDASAAHARVQAMSDSEVQQLAQRVDQAPAGGDVLGLVFTVFIVLLVTDILGLTKVFPFTRSVR